jgi:hypothetical protein
METWSLKDHLMTAGATGLALPVIFVSLLAFVIHSAVTWYRLSHIPGPFLASVSSLWGYRAVKNMAFHLTLQELHEKYGSTVRIGPDSIITSNPETLWRMNSARSNYSRGEWYNSTRTNPWGDTIFSEMDTAKHDKRKAKLAFGFSGKGYMDLEGNLNSQLAVLVDGV